MTDNTIKKIVRNALLNTLGFAPQLKDIRLLESDCDSNVRFSVRGKEYLLLFNEHMMKLDNDDYSLNLILRNDWICLN